MHCCSDNGGYLHHRNKKTRKRSLLFLARSFSNMSDMQIAKNLFNMEKFIVFLLFFNILAI